MTNSSDLNLYDYGLSPLLLPASIDENLLLDATQRWQDCCKDMRELMAGTPSVRTASVPDSSSLPPKRAAQASSP